MRLDFEKKGETKYSIRLKEDTHVPNITGCVIMSSGELALTDNSNDKIKVFDSQFKITSKLSVPGVFDITDINDNEVAVTSPRNNSIRVVKMKPDPEIVRQIHTGIWKCWGVKHQDDIFIVNCSVDEMFTIRGIDNQSLELFQVPTKCCYYSEIAFQPATNMTVISVATSYMGSEKRDEDTQYFIEERSPEDNKNVTVLEYNYLNHLHTRGVTFDSHGNLVVCCRDTNQIYTISQNGDDFELMLAEADGLKCPQALCYTENKDKLYVTSENTDYVQIFEFEH